MGEDPVVVPTKNGQYLIVDERPFKINANVEFFGFKDGFVTTKQEFIFYWKNQTPLNYFFKKWLRTDASAVYDAGHNTVPNEGLDQIAKLLGAIVTGAANAIGYCAVGTGNSPAPGPTSHTLAAQVGTRVIITSVQMGTTGKIHLDTFFGLVSTWNGTIIETGLFKDSSTSGTDVCFAHKAVSSFVKTTTNSMVIAWTLTFVAT